MHAPQIIWIALIAITLGASLALDGKPQKNHSFTRTLIGACIGVAILYWGGFFTGGNC